MTVPLATFITADLTAPSPITGEPIPPLMCLGCGALVPPAAAEIHKNFHALVAQAFNTAGYLAENMNRPVVVPVNDWGPPAEGITRDELLRRAQEATPRRERPAMTFPLGEATEATPVPPSPPALRVYTEGLTPDAPPLMVTKEAIKPRVLGRDEPTPGPDPQSFTIQSETAEPDPLRDPIPPGELAELYPETYGEDPDVRP